MITKEMAVEKCSYGRELHFTGRHPCTRTVGPRGGITEKITRCRVSGKVKTWKRQPEKFEFPVKYGLYENHYVDNYFYRNNEDFHLAEDCPLLRQVNIDEDAASNQEKIMAETGCNVTIS